jgi:hypothetical protein
MMDLKKLVKYLLEGSVVAAALYYVPRRAMDLKLLAVVGLVAAVVFYLMDRLVPHVLNEELEGGYDDYDDDYTEFIGDDSYNEPQPMEEDVGKSFASVV